MNKWKDKPLQELLEAKVNADLHIKTIEANNAEMRKMYMDAKDELTAKAKWEDYLDQLKSPKENNQVAQPLANEKSEPKLDLMEFKKLASDTFEELEAKKRETENFNRVQSKLRDKFGENYAASLQDQQNNLGLTKDEINSLARKSPEAFFRIMGITDQQGEGFQSPPRSNQRNDNFAPKVAKRDYAYYQNLKKTDPKLYLDPKIQVQMERDATDMGMSFFN